MTTVANKFIEELKQGQISEAIETIKSSLHEMTVQKIEEARENVLTSYGFILSEKKKKMTEEDDMEMDDSEEDESDNMDDKEKKDDMED